MCVQTVHVPQRKALILILGDPCSMVLTLDLLATLGNQNIVTLGRYYHLLIVLPRNIDQASSLVSGPLAHYLYMVQSLVFGPSLTFFFFLGGRF